jgi:hypothetical protein
MKVKFHIRFISSLLAIMVLFSSIGLSINAHYCHTTGTFKKSLLPVDLSCADENTEHLCAFPMADTVADTCCAKGHEEKVLHNEDCCEDYNSYLKLLSDFNLSSVKAGFNLFLQVMIAVLDFLLPSAERDMGPKSDLDNPPPQLYGKQLLLAFRQLKLDPATL